MPWNFYVNNGFFYAMSLNQEFKEFITLLNSEGVDYVVVGGFAVAYHGHPRFTGDLDILVRIHEENAEKLLKVLGRFGFGSLGIARNDFLAKRQVIQLGYAPVRIDLLTSLDGLDGDEVLNRKIQAEIYGTSVPMIRREDLLVNKRAMGRARDLADLENLEGKE